VLPREAAGGPAPHANSFAMLFGLAGQLTELLSHFAVHPLHLWIADLL
jgi:hypothetical protein